MNGQLFRAEASRHRADRLQGNVNIATPVAWQVIGFLLLFMLVIAVSFLSMASYARVETVPGSVVLDKGVATIVPSRPGIVSGIFVVEGQPVRIGTTLATIRAEENMIAGATAPDRIRKALGEQDARLEEQSKLLLQAAEAERGKLKAQLDGALAALPQLKRQIADQMELLTTAEADYRNAVEVAKRGFISKRDVQDRQAVVLSRRQQLAQLQQTRSAKYAEVAQAQRAMSEASATGLAQAANAQSARAALSQQLAQADSSQGYALTTPVDGVVTAVTARPGQLATVDRQLMLVIPTGAWPTVELYVPTSSAGFIAPGQDVRLSIDAFPYQSFGTVNARVTAVSRAVISRQSATGTVQVFLVNAAVPKPWIVAFGRRRQLLPGMTLSARIITEKRSIIEWLFEPLFAICKR